MRRPVRHSRVVAASRWSRQHNWLIGLLAVVIVAAAAAITYVAVPQHSSPNAAGHQAAPPNPGERSPSSVPPTAVVDVAALTADFARLAGQLHAKAGVVVRPVGSATVDPITFGDWTAGPAWSTVKVPLVIAGLRQQKSAQVTAQMKAAIIESDNAAAESIWDNLGDPGAAAAAVAAVLHSTGDPTTVESRKLRPEYTAFGQTDWSLTNQTRFLAAAACDPDDAPVLELMRQVDPGQRWGLGTLPGTAIKGGWGPSPTGRYLVRQIAVVPTPAGSAAVALAAEPDSGAFDDGTQALNRLAQWLQTHLAGLPAAHCGTG